MKQAQIIPLLNFQSGALPFKMQTIKHFTLEQNDLNEGPHSHDYYEMIWLTKGKGILLADLRQYAIDENTVLLLKPGQPHQFQTAEEMEGFVLSFTDSFFRMDEYDFDWATLAGLTQLFTEDHTIKVSFEMAKDLDEIVIKMMKEFDSNYPYKMELLKRYFKIFLIYLTREVNENLQSAEQSRETELVKNFLNLLDRNFKETKMVADYAGQLSVTPNYLNRIIKKNTGFAAGHYIRQRVVKEAKRMGRYSDAGMKEIAYNLGFLDTAHFSRFFKTFAGENFSEFKKSGLVVPMHVNFNRA